MSSLLNAQIRKAIYKAAVYICFVCLFFVSAFSRAQPPFTSPGFTIAVIPDTQNYVDFTLQKSAGFALDSSTLFIQQMEYIASKSINNGGDIVFVASVGDVWQHVFSNSDPEHVRRGIVNVDSNPAWQGIIRPDETQNFEIPKAIEGYQLISNAGIPFGVAPGNHDYDAWFLSKNAGIAAEDEITRNNTQIHYGGLDAFRMAFGRESSFFKDKDWYVSAFDGGSNSAQIFTAGGYRFLHLAFEMHAGDQVLAWAQVVIDANPELPVLISTHDFLNPRGERLPTTNLALVDPAFNNTSEQIWEKFIRHNDQILMVFSGHQLGQALRIDDNEYGHKVYQLLADYQGRGQAGLDAGAVLAGNGRATGIGDGWYREMTFYLGGERPRVDVKTYSTHYRQYSGELDNYVQWYKADEQPEMSDIQFLQADEFTLELNDFYQRFGRSGD